MNNEAAQRFSSGHSNKPIERFISPLQQHASATARDLPSAPTAFMRSAADYRTYAGRRFAAPGIVEPQHKRMFYA